LNLGHNTEVFGEVQPTSSFQRSNPRILSNIIIPVAQHLVIISAFLTKRKTFLKYSFSVLPKKGKEAIAAKVEEKPEVIQTREITESYEKATNIHNSTNGTLRGSHEVLMINLSQLVYDPLGILGFGSQGVAFRAKWKNRDVVFKKIKYNSTAHQKQFMDELKVWK
jgi:hypothetical protein